MVHDSGESPRGACAEVSTSSRSSHTTDVADAAQLWVSEWFDASEQAELRALRALRERQRRYEFEAEGLWGALKAALAHAITAHNARIADSAEITCAETVTGGFAVTRFAHPLALLDVAIDIESGMIACIYTLGTRASSSCRERLNVLLIRGTDSEWFLTDRNGKRLVVQESAHEVIEPYLLHLRTLSVS